MRHWCLYVDVDESGNARRGENNLAGEEGHPATSITLHQLEIFAAIVREGGFSRAAAALLLSEPTISEQVKLLERAVGERLLERGPGRSHLDVTPAGHLLFETCAEIFSALERYQHHLRSQRREQQASMTFGFSQHFPGYPLPSLFASFRHEHPEIVVRVSLQLRQQLIESLRRGELELAALVPPVDEPGLLTETLSAFDQVLVGPVGHPLARLSTRVPFGHLADESFVMFEAPSVVRRELEVRAVSSGIRLTTVWETGSDEGVMSAILSGLGIGVVTYTTAAPHIESRAVEVLCVESFPWRSYWLLTHLEGRLSGPAEVFKRYALAQRQRIEARTLAPPGLLPCD